MSLPVFCSRRAKGVLTGKFRNMSALTFALVVTVTTLLSFGAWNFLAPTRHHPNTRTDTAAPSDSHRHDSTKLLAPSGRWTAQQQTQKPASISANVLPRVLAIVFPQFHADPLNDKLWGEGFTDWNSLRAAPKKNRYGFEIPRPTELGYYDYTDVKARKRQGELAVEYGVDGFVFHHYWFYDPSHPGPNLHAPLMAMLQDGQPNIPFCLHWCAAHWTREWLDQTIVKKEDMVDGLLQPQHFPANASDPAVTAHYNWLRQFFHHPNYIKVNGQPLFMIYRKKAGSFIILDRLRQLAIQDGFPGLYIIMGMAFTHDDLWPAGRHTGQTRDLSYTFKTKHLDPDLVNRLAAYPNPSAVPGLLKVPEWCTSTLRGSQMLAKRSRQVPGIPVSFDNTPRRKFEEALVWSNFTPAVVVDRFYQNLYAMIYYDTCCFTPEAKIRNTPDDERIVLINSMNEWAEGMSLEPSDVFGHRFLEAVRDAKANVQASGCLKPANKRVVKLAVPIKSSDTDTAHDQRNIIVIDSAVQNAIERIRARNGYLCTKNTDISQWRAKTGGPPAFHKVAATSGSVISLLSPVYNCPWTLHRTNYVSDSQFDGGKWTCGLVDMYRSRLAMLEVRPCIVYSFGSNNDDFFENDILKQNPNCEVHIFDPTSGKPPASWKSRYHFHQSGLCVGDVKTFKVRKKTFPCKNLQDHMIDLGHTYVDILKADVEGMEWEITKHWGGETRIGQVLLEFHFWVESPLLPSLLRDHLIPMEKMGYFIHTIEPVAAKIEAFEMTFLNLNWSPEGVSRKIYDTTMYPSTPGVDI